MILNDIGVKTPLLNLAKQLFNERTDYKADFLAPPVLVNTLKGNYKTFADKAAFQTYEAKRATFGPTKRIFFDAADNEYSCEPRALEVVIDDNEIAANGDKILLYQAKLQCLVSDVLKSHEKYVMDQARTVSAIGGAGVWSTNSATVYPVKEIMDAMNTICLNTSRIPNRILMGWGSFNYFVNHVNVKNFFPGAAMISPATVAGLFQSMGLQFEVGTVGYDVNQLGLTKSGANIVGSDVFIFYADQTPNVYDASALKTFTLSSGITDIVDYRDETNSGDIIKIKWNVDTKVTSTVSIARIVVS